MSELRAVVGFEATGYAWLGDELVWARAGGGVDHPRHMHSRWQPTPLRMTAARLRNGAAIATTLLQSRSAGAGLQGLLPWYLGSGACAFPLNHAEPRLNAVRAALERNDAVAFALAAPRLLGLGPGLTPSGDDFIGAALFALAHAPRAGWARPLRALRGRLLGAAIAGATNPISTALLSDLMSGVGYRPLHELLAALNAGDVARIAVALSALLTIGASSGADLTAGLLAVLSTTPIPEAARTAITPSP